MVKTVEKILSIENLPDKVLLIAKKVHPWCFQVHFCTSNEAFVFGDCMHLSSTEINRELGLVSSLFVCYMI